MTALRVEADESASKVEDLTAKVKTLEHANLAKEQEITSLAHKNQLLEQEVEKLETGIREVKEDAAEGSRHGKQNENLTRKLQTLEDEAEETDRKLKELNDKYVAAAPEYAAQISVTFVVISKR